MNGLQFFAGAFIYKDQLTCVVRPRCPARPCSPGSTAPTCEHVAPARLLMQQCLNPNGCPTPIYGQLQYTCTYDIKTGRPLGGNQCGVAALKSGPYAGAPPRNCAVTVRDSSLGFSADVCYAVSIRQEVFVRRTADCPHQDQRCGLSGRHLHGPVRAMSLPRAH